MTRRSAVLATLACAAALGATAAGTWVSARAWTPLQERTLAVSGLEASPVLGAVALLLVAAALALAMAGRRAARLIGIAVVVAGVLAGASTLAVALDPAVPARGAAEAALGVARVADAAATALPWLALAEAAACLVVGAAVLVAAGGWARGHGSRYRRATQDPAPAPTTDAARAAPATQRTPATPAVPDDVAAWDALTRGEDPT